MGRRSIRECCFGVKEEVMSTKGKGIMKRDDVKHENTGSGCSIRAQGVGEDDLPPVS